MDGNLRAACERNRGGGAHAVVVAVTTFIGIDASLTNTGVAMLPGPCAGLQTYSLKPSDKLRGVERLAWFRERFNTLLGEVKGTGAIALEGYAFGARNGREALGELGGVIRLAARDRGMAVLVVPPSVLKKYVTGKGNADKALMLMGVYKRWSMDFMDHNLADAYALARFAQELHAEKQTKALGELRKKCQAI